MTDSRGTHWVWDHGVTEDTAHLLGKLENTELAIERTNVTREAASAVRARESQQNRAPAKTGGRSGTPVATRDAGGGFNPYDNPGKRGR